MLMQAVDYLGLLRFHLFPKSIFTYHGAGTTPEKEQETFWALVLAMHDLASSDKAIEELADLILQVAETIGVQSSQSAVCHSFPSFPSFPIFVHAQLIDSCPLI